MADSGESHWIERAQSAEAKINTLKESYGPAIEKVQAFKANFGVIERSDGTIDIDYDKFVENIGMAGALELRAIIDEKYKISGAPGEKPKVRLPSSASTQAGESNE